MTKSWYKSYTFWFNILTAIGSALAVLASAYPDAAWITMVLSLVNLGLRFKTTTALTL